jgi:hypothetical protein
MQEYTAFMEFKFGTQALQVIDLKAQGIKAFAFLKIA